MVKVTVDFETRSDVDLKKCGAYEYSMGANTSPTCFAIKKSDCRDVTLMDFYEINTPWIKLRNLIRVVWTQWLNDPDIIFSAHNAFFEQCIYNNVLVRRYGWPPIPINKWRCTAAKAAAVAIPRNLQDAGAVMRTPVQKDFTAHAIVMKLCKPTKYWKEWVHYNGASPGPEMFWSPKTAPEDFAGLYKYCKQDVIAEEQLDRALPDLNEFEQRLWFIDQKINLRGTNVDMKAVNWIALTMAGEAKTMNKELDYLTMGLVSSGNKRAAILDFLTIEGIEMPDLKAKTVDEFLSNGKANGDAKKILEIRRSLSKSSTAKYHTFQRRARSDGRVRDLLLYHGASTGRWGGVGIQPQNFPRGIIKDIWLAIDLIKTCTREQLKLSYGENLMPLFSSVLRGMFTATPGYELFVEDFAAIECRVTWWLAGYDKGLKMFIDGRDPYIEMAAAIFNKPILKVTPEERQVGKAAVLGCGFQMGWKKFMASAWDVYRVRVTKEIAKIAVTKYREKHWPVTELWENYQNAAMAAIKNPGKRYRVDRVKFFVDGRFLFIELPSGRRLAYADPKVIWEKVEIKNDEDEVTSSFSADKICYYAVNLKAKRSETVIPKWALEKTYGGKIVENVVQAVARDLLAEAIVRADAKGFDVLFHSHDEAVAEAPKGRFNPSEYNKVMTELPAWADGLPIKSSGWSGVRYKKG